MKSFMAILTVALLLAFSGPAMAYIDPGSGSAIMSAIVGFFVAISMIVKTYWYKLKSKFSAGKDRNEEDSAAEEPAGDS